MVGKEEGRKKGGEKEKRRGRKEGGEKGNGKREIRAV